MRRVITVMFALAVAGLSTTKAAHAVDVKDQNSAGFEFGVGLGQAQLEGSIAGVGSLSDNATGFNAFGGYRFSRYFSIEGAYLDGGTHSIRATDGVDTASMDFHPRAAQLSAVGTLPIGDYFGLFARAGADYWWLKTTVTFDDLSANETDTKATFAWGAGAEVFVDGAQIRLEYQQSNDDESLGAGLPNLDLRERYISASVVWLF